MVAPISTTAAVWSFPPFGSCCDTSSQAVCVAYDSTSTTKAFRPALSAAATRSSTFSLREAAISTSTSSAPLGAGPSTWKSKLTSSSAKGIYWFASVSTWASSSSSLKPAGTMIFLVITAAAGKAKLTCLIRVPMRFHARRIVSATASRFMMLPSVTASFGRLSIAYRSTRSRFLPACSISTIFTAEELMSTPISGGD